MKAITNLFVVIFSIVWWISAYYIGLINCLIITVIAAMLIVFAINLEKLFYSDESINLPLIIKRILDISVSSFGIIFLSPIFILIGIIIKFTSEGPIFYHWQVIGKDGNPFTGYKFRTMILNADKMKGQYLDKNEMSGPVFKIKNDPKTK